MSVELIQKYFPNLTEKQIKQFTNLDELYKEWNEKINVISRKDMDSLYEKHILHSMGIAKVMAFSDRTKVLDIGTGGGFPGIPLAIYFPEVTFILTDSVAKKITVVNEVVKALDLKNVSTKIERAENINLNVDYIVTRAVAKMSDLIFWSKNKNPKKIIALKGGDLKDELNNIKKNIRIIDIHEFYSEEFFETKKIVICS